MPTHAPIWFSNTVRETVLPEHNEVMRGKRGGAARRKAREVKVDEAESLADLAWDQWHQECSREDAERVMRKKYGFIEWFFFGWQLISLIRSILSLLYPTAGGASEAGA